MLVDSSDVMDINYATEQTSFRVTEVKDLLTLILPISVLS